jgi:hypothetical protein
LIASSRRFFSSESSGFLALERSFFSLDVFGFSSVFGGCWAVLDALFFFSCDEFSFLF